MNNRRRTLPVALFPSRLRILRFFLSVLLLLACATGRAQDSSDADLARIQALRAEEKDIKTSQERRRIHDEIITRFAGNSNEAIQENVAWAMVAKARDNRDEESERLIAEVIEKYGNSDNGELRLQVANAKYLRAIRLKGKEERVQALEAIIAEYKDDSGSEMQDFVDNAAFVKAEVSEDAAGIMATGNSIIERLSGKKDDDSRSRIARIMLRQARAIPEAEAKIRLLDELVARFDDDPAKYVQNSVESALYYKGFFRRICG